MFSIELTDDEMTSILAYKGYRVFQTTLDNEIIYTSSNVRYERYREDSLDYLQKRNLDEKFLTRSFTSVGELFKHIVKNGG